VSATQSVKLSCGPVEYRDTGGAGPIVLLLHGLLMDHSLWDGVIEELARDHRCIAPTLPLGAHRWPIDEAPSLQLAAQLVVELMDELDLEGVTVVGNDTGGAIAQLLAVRHVARMKRLVLVSCDAFDNYPPGLTGRSLVLLGKLPPRLFGLFMQQLRLKLVRRLPIAFGWLTKRGDGVTRQWITPLLTQPEIVRATVALLRRIGSEPQLLTEAAARLSEFDRPALVVWASEDRVMPPEHGRKLADLLPQSRLVEVGDAYTLVPLDRPAELAHRIREFTRATSDLGPGHQTTRQANGVHA
jgi:pimeloyl-ACP methyl ester carboxylesterase